VKLTWLGHSGVLVETSGVRVVADPLLRARVGLLRRVHALPGAVRDVLERGVDAVLLSHLHHDHCDLPSLRRLQAPLVIAPPGAGGWLERQGVTGVVELAPGDAIDLGRGARVVATPAEHLGRREPWGPTAMSVGHLVEGARTAWLAGDTSLFAGMARLSELSRRGVIDVAAVPVWGWGPTLGPGHLNPDRAAEAVVRAGVRCAVPVHWGTLHPLFLRRFMAGPLGAPGPLFSEALGRLQAQVTSELLPVGATLSVR
jgi:L-ascorbate metabolism protein UlaG (beta-lactamase superfamily)